MIKDLINMKVTASSVILHLIAISMLQPQSNYKTSNVSSALLAQCCAASVAAGPLNINFNPFYVQFESELHS